MCDTVRNAGQLTAMGFEKVLTARDVNLRANDISSNHPVIDNGTGSHDFPSLQRHSYNTVTRRKETEELPL